ncbi:Uncharacterised protein [Catenibacterium mitsuokai]|uniref:hypothetical protein n=1 Tax=Catenibacterium mitsuokai TaxID=100886 RepID=UPI0006C20265|nr:hypothetical protein [Catenibacterium mitsuokai]CUP42846.1 Uncharacterised protein [Catenibacterium mitsuokai]
MYNYVTNKQLISRMRSGCGEIMQDLCHTLKEEYDIGATFTLVGSGARNLILQNANEPIDLDYNLKIVRSDDWDCKYIKECFRKAFNIVLRKHGWRDCEDSKSSLTTKKHYLSGSKTLFSIDVCIVYEDEDGNLYRLIHKKTGYNNVNSIAYAASIYPGLVNEYYWNKAPNSRDIKLKVDYIKSNGKWELVREQYKSIKNRYLTQNDHNHPSFICYIEAVNNVYNSRKHWKQ